MHEIFTNDLVGREVLILAGLEVSEKGKQFSFVALNDGSTQENSNCGRSKALQL